MTHNGTPFLTKGRKAVTKKMVTTVMPVVTQRNTTPKQEGPGYDTAEVTS